MSDIAERVNKSLKNVLTIKTGKTQLLQPERNHQIPNENQIPLLMEEMNVDEDYIVSLSGAQKSEWHDVEIGVALSDYSCAIYSIDQYKISKTVTFNHNQAPIVGIKIRGLDMYIANAAGLITMCDRRVDEKVVAEFKADIDGEMKPLASFDVNNSGSYIAGGTENTDGDSFIIFWDDRMTSAELARRPRTLGAYWNSHKDDITALAFNPFMKQFLASGSTDGLINVFDLYESSEDAALQYTFNTESSVDRVDWFPSPSYGSLWSTTHTHKLNLWRLEDVGPYKTFTRDQFAESLNNEPDDCYVVGVHSSERFAPFVLAGCSTANRESLRCLNFERKCLETIYELDNTQLVRDSWIYEKEGCLVTGGESGIIDVWRQTESTYGETSYKLADKVDVVKKNRTKPY